ncbi:hypothetical protein LAZ67_23000907 [Cordylochernes scorpioides]|uniref:Reverse transcriptase n=1 Tax=Cordylochernes scorpioides TaxID=51811 RepID=A0ABY6LSS5_9ARAC|nr:hypothetical protein LAZ67_23000907 [Cordylochernes scorpioides]
MVTMLSGVEGVIAYLDDILIAANQFSKADVPIRSDSPKATEFMIPRGAWWLQGILHCKFQSLRLANMFCVSRFLYIWREQWVWTRFDRAMTVLIL